MRRLLTTLLLVATALTSATAQHTLDSLYMFVTLNRDGSAQIQEQRYMNICNDGTECFIKMYNMGDMEVCDLSVWEGLKDSEGRDTTVIYVNDGDWDVNRSRSQKAFHCGINKVSEGQELCWGVGSSGYHAYIVEYTIKGLVKGYSDFDGFNHNFYEAGNPPAEDARIIIELGDDYHCVMARTADSTFVVPVRDKQCDVRNGILRVADPEDTTLVKHYALEDMFVQQDTLGRDTASIWAFGYYGSIHFNNGHIVAQTYESMGQDDKIIIMCRFKKGLFDPELKYPDQSFETDVKELAFIDSDYPLDDDGDGSRASFFGGDTTPMWERILFMSIGGFCCIGLPLLLIIYAIFGRRISAWFERRKVRKLLVDAPQYNHEIPLQGKLIDTRRVLRAMEPSADTSEMKLVEAYVLRLVDNKLLDVVSETTSNGDMRQVFRIVEPAVANKLFAGATEDNSIIRQLHALLYTAAGADHLLQPKEFKQLVEDDPVTVRTFARKLRDANGKLLRAKQITRDQAQQVYGFWNYLRDFSLVGERALQEVALWKEYLTFATLFGIADQVRADMKRIAPDLQSFDKLTRHIVEDTGSTALLYSALSNSIMDSCRRTINYETAAERSARLAREAREARRSGGGGRSSFGGGGGFSGGGGSGVR